MPATPEVLFGLLTGYSVGEDGWDAGWNANFLRIANFGVHVSVLDRHLSAPPGSPAAGDRYIVGPSPTGAWATHAGELTEYSGSAWVFSGTPKTGWQAWVVDEKLELVWTGAAWGYVAQMVTLLSDPTGYTRNSDNATDVNEVSLKAYTLKGGTLGPADSLRIAVLWEFSASAIAQHFLVELGGVEYTHIADASTSDIAEQTVTWVHADGSTSAQVGGPVNLNDHGPSANALVTSALNMANDQTIDVRCHWANNVAGESIKARHILIQLVRG